MTATRLLPPRLPPAVWPLLLGLAACGGGGGGGGPVDAAPTLVAASFVGLTATPASGDTLLLTFSEPVTLGAGALLDDADLALPTGATLGAVTQPPAQSTTNTVSVQLGAGAALAPGFTTLALRDPLDGAGNDVVRDASNQLGRSGTAVVLATSDGSAPTLGNVTLADVDGALNGTGPAAGVLQVPANGWTIDLAYVDNGTIATGLTRITASVFVGTPGGSVPPDTDLVPFLTEESATGTAARYRVPAGVTFPDGAVTLRALVVDTSGRGSTPASFAATVRAFNDQRRPFETNVHASQLWFLDFSRDIESFTTTPQGTGVDVVVTAGGNGRSDFEDLLRVLGLQTATPLPNVIGGQNSNQVVLARLQQTLLAELASFYAGANVDFTLTQPGDSFGDNSSLPYGAISHSRIAIAGSSNLTGVLGVAIFDLHNETQNDDTELDFAGTRLGIFLHTIVDAGLGSVASTAFRLTFDPFVPSLGGTPIGADANDDDRLTGALTDARSDAIDAALSDLARFTAVVTAHECGHSMGLVQNGPMPGGLYGNDTVNFPGSSDGHIRTASLFPPGATNLMSPALSWSSAIHPATAFNSLNLAYLREQVTYGN